jgi:tetratricopeptide (TPR) repeat protein
VIRSGQALRIASLLGLVLAIGAASAILLPARSPYVDHRTSTAADSALAAGRNQQVAFYADRVRRDPASWLDWAQLGGLYLQRSRETGDHDDLHRAEEAARRSLALDSTRNGRSFVTLANALLGQHRFAAARDVARELVDGACREPAYVALLAEIEMELGDYDAARARFTELDSLPEQLGSLPRRARWLELQGKITEARFLLQRAVDLALERRHEIPPEQLSWFYLRRGDFEFRAGDVGAAERAYREGAKIRPGDSRLLVALGRLAANRGRWRDALECAQAAAAGVADLPALMLLRDAHAAVGDTARAATFDRAVARRAAVEHPDFNRAWTSDLLDHDRQLPAVLAQLKREIAVRRDVYGWDLLAWAFYKNGRCVEARAAMAQALRLGTQDARLDYHMGMIERALGHHDAALMHLERALVRNPNFDSAQADIARSALAGLRAAAEPLLASHD